MECVPYNFSSLTRGVFESKYIAAVPCSTVRLQHFLPPFLLPLLPSEVPFPAALCSVFPPFSRAIEAPFISHAQPQYTRQNLIMKLKLTLADLMVFVTLMSTNLILLVIVS